MYEFTIYSLDQQPSIMSNTNNITCKSPEVNWEKIHSQYRANKFRHSKNQDCNNDRYEIINIRG